MKNRLHVTCIWMLADSVVSTAAYASAATKAWYFAKSRDLRRAALFLWMTPLSATRSSTLTARSVAASAALASPDAIATSAFFTNVRASVRSGLLLSRRRSATRMRFFDDLELAKFGTPPQVNNIKEPVHWQRARNGTKLRHFPQDAIETQTSS